MDTEAILREIREADKTRNARLDDIELKLGRSLLPSAVDPQKYPNLSIENRALNLTTEDKAFLQFIRHGVAGMDSNERKALVEDATGQYLVSSVITSEIDRAVAELVVMRGLCAKKTQY